LKEGQQQHFFIVFFSTRGGQLMSGGHEGQSRKVKEGQQHFFSVFFSARGGFRPAVR
jgi:hypothetical protein